MKAQTLIGLQLILLFQRAFCAVTLTKFVRPEPVEKYVDDLNLKEKTEGLGFTDIQCAAICSRMSVTDCNASELKKTESICKTHQLLYEDHAKQLQPRPVFTRMDDNDHDQMVGVTDQEFRPSGKLLVQYYKSPVYVVNFDDREQTCRAPSFEKFPKKSGNIFEFLGILPDGTPIACNFNHAGTICLGENGVRKKFSKKDLTRSSIGYQLRNGSVAFLEVDKGTGESEGRVMDSLKPYKVRKIKRLGLKTEQMAQINDTTLLVAKNNDSFYYHFYQDKKDGPKAIDYRSFFVLGIVQDRHDKTQVAVIAGGSNGGKILLTSEILNLPNGNQWKTGPPLIKEIYGSSSVTAPDGKRAIFAGGRDIGYRPKYVKRHIQQFWCIGGTCHFELLDSEIPATHFPDGIEVFPRVARTLLFLPERMVECN